MRGIHRTINSRKESLKDTLLSLDEYLDTLADAESDKEKFCRELNSFDFPRRGKDTEEEKIQAAFISGMISRDAEYEGIHFLASELILLDENNPKRNRFDVVGYKNHILYIFELKPDGYKETKRKRDEGIFDQIIRYRDHFDANSQKFKTLFAAYPRIACPETVEKIETVKYIAVMKEEQLSTHDWMEEAKNARVDVWLFRSALAFRKVSQ